MRKTCLVVVGIFLHFFSGFAQSSTDSGYESRKLKLEEVNLVSSYYHQEGNNSAVTGGQVSVGIVVNDSALSTNPQSMTYAQGLRATNGPGGASSGRSGTSWTGYLNAGDIVTFKDDNSSTLTDGECMASITKVSN